MQLNVAFQNLGQALKRKPSGDVWKDMPDIESGSDVVDTVFGLRMEETMQCHECDAEPVVKKESKVFNIKCNIQGGAGSDVQINHMHEGILLGLEGIVFLHSNRYQQQSNSTSSPYTRRRGKELRSAWPQCDLEENTADLQASFHTMSTKR